jgi:hypothetical protein
MRHWTRVGLAGSAALAAGLFVVVDGEAQTVNPAGQAPVTDVSGTIVTSGDMVAGMLVGQPGTVQSFFCPEATGVRNAGHILTAELDLGAMWVVTQAPGVRMASAGMTADVTGAEERQFLLSAELQHDLAVLLVAGEGLRAASRSIEAGLTPQSNSSRSARRAARDLVRDLEGLVEATSAMDVHAPGHEVPTHLTRTVARYNAFINASSEEFLRNPTEELMAVEAVLSRFIVAAMDNHGDESACGGPLPASPTPPVAETPPPPPAPERATTICLFTDGDLKDVMAIHLPLTNETLVAVNGERRPIAEVYPEDGSLAKGADLAVRDEPIKFGEREYLTFGLPRAVSPSDVVRAGEVDGVSVFHETGAESPPEVIYIPVAAGCMAQPFQRQELVRQVQG